MLFYSMNEKIVNKKAMIELVIIWVEFMLALELMIFL